jgi:hypothetical protein
MEFAFSDLQRANSIYLGADLPRLLAPPVTLRDRASNVYFRVRVTTDQCAVKKNAPTGSIRRCAIFLDKSRRYSVGYGLLPAPLNAEDGEHCGFTGPDQRRALIIPRKANLWGSTK